MYGYVRPLKGELKVREYEQYKAAYCGLCHQLKRRCGFAARFVVNYDFTFMAMLLSDSDSVSTIHRRCTASPFRKKCCLCAEPALDVAADYSVILAYWKLKDSIHDDSFLKKLYSRICLFLLLPAYRKAAGHAPAFNQCTRSNLENLQKIEAEKSASLDAAVNCFARILESVSGDTDCDNRKRILSQIFYHIGRIIYILDAVDDLPEDFETGAYNPLIYRFGLTDGTLTDDARKTVELTVHLSENALRSAFELLPVNSWTSILSNIIYDGLPWILRLVMDGSWREMRKIKKHKMNGADIDERSLQHSRRILRR